MASETTPRLREETALSILNPTPTRFSGPTLLHHLLRLELLQNDTAIHYLSSSWAKTSLTYGDLHSRAEALASRISTALHRSPGGDNLQSGSSQLIIPILVPQCPDLYVSLLAVLKAGGAFCPLNLDAPPDRVKFVLEDISARIVLTTTDLSHKIPPEGSNVAVITVDAPQESGTNGEACPALITRRDARASDLAYVMYTSGSTGTPKGVGISHDAATQSLLAHDQHIPNFRRFLQFAAPTFDVSVFETFFPLFRGATLVCADRRLMLDDLPAVLREMAVDGCELTPTVAASLLRKRDNAPSLKLLLTIGEMLTGPVVGEFGGDEDGAESMLWAMYGPTEATIHWYVGHRSQTPAKPRPNLRNVVPSSLHSRPTRRSTTSDYRSLLSLPLSCHFQRKAHMPIPTRRLCHAILSFSLLGKWESSRSVAFSSPKAI